MMVLTIRIMELALEGMTEFSLSIYNRWGEQIFGTKDPTEGWKKIIKAIRNRMGSMSALCNTKTIGNPHELKGFATLIR